MSKDLALINAKEMSLVENSALNANQLGFIFRKTPDKYIRQRPAKGGGQWKYVSGGYVKKCLNLMFGFDWSFEIQEQMILHGEAIVKGKLTCNTNGKTITKTQFGNKDIVYKKEPDKNGERIPLSIGNDLKSAATDCLKKCAAEIGIAADIYNAEEFREVIVTDEPIPDLDTLKTLLAEKKAYMTEQAVVNAQRIINNKESNSFEKLFKELISVAQ